MSIVGSGLASKIKRRRVKMDNLGLVIALVGAAITIMLAAIYFAILRLK